jgi:hypothetical protein
MPPASEASKGLLTSKNGRTSTETRGTVLYIASLAEELEQLAKSHDLDHVAGSQSRTKLGGGSLRARTHRRDRVSIVSAT